MGSFLSKIILKFQIFHVLNVYVFWNIDDHKGSFVSLARVWTFLVKRTTKENKASLEAGREVHLVPAPLTYPLEILRMGANDPETTLDPWTWTLVGEMLSPAETEHITETSKTENATSANCPDQFYSKRPRHNTKLSQMGWCSVSYAAIVL